MRRHLSSSHGFLICHSKHIQEFTHKKGNRMIQTLRKSGLYLCVTEKKSRNVIMH